MASMGPMSGRRQWRERAARAVVDKAAPTWVMDLSALGDGPDGKHARQVVDLCLRIGALMLGTGATAAETTATMLRLTHTYGLEHAHVDVTYTSVMISSPRGVDEDPLTAMRTVSDSSRDYARLGRVALLVTSLTNDPVPVSDARRRFEAIARMPKRYRGWVVTLAQGGTGLGISLLLGAGILEMILSMIATATSFRVVGAAGRRGLPSFFAQVLGAAVPTTMALLIVMLRNVEFVANLGLSPSRIVAAGIVVLVAGTSAMNSARDLIDGFYVTAGARTFQVMSATLGIVLGVSGTLWIGQHLDIPGYISTRNLVGGFAPIQIVAAGISAAAMAVSNYAPPRAVQLCFVVGGLAWGLKALAQATLEVGYPTACGVAAIAVGLTAQLIAGRSAIPDHAIAIPSVVAMVPGSMIYRGLNGMFDASSMAAASPAVVELLNAAITGLALAFGIALGSWLGRPLRLAWDEGARWFENKAVDRRNPARD